MNALWRQQWIDATRVTGIPNLSRMVVAIDPPTQFERDEGDLAGIVAAGLHEGRAYVIADRSCGGHPSIWGKAVASAFLELKADVVAVEPTYARDLVAHVIRSIAPDIPVKAVTIKRGKYMRAEPISAAYAEGRIVHCGHFQVLESQMCQFGKELPWREDHSRLDALMLALAELMMPAQTPRSKTA